MKILVVGSGGREHAIVRKLKESPLCGELFCCPGNGGISADARCVSIKATDVDGVVAFAKENGIDFVVVTPDDPLVLGMVDALAEAGIKAFGPSRNAAVIEGSKVFAKEFMKKYKIPTAGFEIFSNPDEAMAYMEKNERYPIVVKADGLALGKGVIIAGDRDEGISAIRTIMLDRAFGESGANIVIEEFLEGMEATVLTLTDSHTIVPLVSSMDHKRALDGDMGLNTGGMGTIAPNPYVTDAVLERCMREIFVPTVEKMKEEGRPFKGCLYFGLMVSPSGAVKVVEYNCRFGDPETQVVLELMDGDLLEAMIAATDERLGEVEIGIKPGAAACVIAASGGYPGKYETGYPISGLRSDGQADGVSVYHAGTRIEDGIYKTAGGRVLGITGRADTLEGALEKAYDAAGSIRFENMHYRRDIGKRAMGGK